MVNSLVHEKILIIFFLLANSTVLFADDESQIVGTKAEEWIVSDWIHSRPLSLGDLSGKVVLVRWWTDPYCPYCTASAPALNEWYEAYKDKGPHRYWSLSSQVFYSFRNTKGKRVFYQPWIYIPYCH